jgi:hypothetical protein
MDLLMKHGAQLAPKDTAEAIGIFRAQVIGPLLTRVFASHGELADAIRALSRERHRAPSSSTTRTYSEATLERWYYRFKKRGLVGITPRGKSPSEVYETAPRYDHSVDDAALGIALTVHGRRRVRRDGTLEIGGMTFETRTGFLAGRVVVVGRSLLDPTSDPWIEHEGQRYLVGRVDAQENARRKKHGPFPKRGRRGIDVPFDPAGALVDALVGRHSDDGEEGGQ